MLRTGARVQPRSRSSARARLAGASLALALASGGCTLLARFDDLPGAECDGGGCADATVPVSPLPDASPGPVDAGPTDAGASDARSRADAAAPSDAAPCEGLKSGTYCANDGLHDYPGSPSDLVVCDGGAIATVRRCDAGCLPLSNPFPDTCNACDQKANGLYCGRDFLGFPAENADFLIQCQASNAVQIVTCAHGCLSKAAGATCAP